MWELKIVRERKTGYGASRVAIKSSEDVFERFRVHFEKLDREEFAIVLFDSKNYPLGFHVVSVGSLGASLVHPRETFKAAVLASAASIILMHNHPSGDPEPSAEDRHITARLKDAGDLLGIPVIDHIVIGDERYVSFADQGEC